MASVPSPTESDAQQASSEERLPYAAKAGKSTSVRRRTKTGCLTCRKRRIKCGEERPKCKNCIKSKRDCAGYVQPLVYKQHASQPYPSVETEFVQREHDSRYHAHIAAPGFWSTSCHVSPQGPMEMPRSYHQVANSGTAALIWPGSRTMWHTSANMGASPAQTSRHPFQSEGIAWPAHLTPLTEKTLIRPEFCQDCPHGSGSQHVPHGSSNGSRRYSETFSKYPWTTTPGSALTLAGTAPFVQPMHVAESTSDSIPPVWMQGAPNPLFEVDTPSHRFTFESVGLATEDVSKEVRSGPMYYDNRGQMHPAMRSYSVPQIPEIVSQPLPDDANANWEDPEDPWDVEVDDNAGPPERKVKNEPDTLAWPYARLFNHPGTAMTCHASFTAIASPLLEEKNSHMFSHFATCLATCLNVFERPPVLKQKHTLATVWGFDIPCLALARPALAHAILALAALHLAILRGMNEDLAVKHFTYGIRRVGRALAMPNRRHEAATLATVLLLGFYEVLAGDHSRWIMHLNGAGPLLMEHDFAGMMRAVRRMRDKAKSNIEQPWARAQGRLSSNDYVRIADVPELLLHDEDWDVDEKLVSQLTGWDVDYSSQTQARHHGLEASHELTAEEVKDWKVKMDLFWWYCKMDIFQSLLSGDSLLLSYSDWKHCPPRGPIGVAEAAHATADHLWLILARLARFGGKDRNRKQRVIESQGGHWIPGPGFFGPLDKSREGSSVSGPRPSRASNDGRRNREDSSGTIKLRAEHPPSANEGRARRAKLFNEPPSQPMFHGMMPPPAQGVRMHSAFYFMEAQLQGNSAQASSSTSPSVSEDAQDAETRRAFDEHTAIDKALKLWAASLGPDFEPVSRTPETTAHTPFGPSLHYRSPLVACTWAFFYLSRIQLRRVHPQSPPAAMTSSAINASFTRDDAQLIGRIVGGIHAEFHSASRVQQPNMALVAAMQETTFPLMFAGVQYQDAGQRGWTITKLRDVAERTGWRSSAAVASACETTWHTMGVAGKGPPYERTLNQRGDDLRCRPRQPENTRKDSVTGVYSPEEDYESQFVNHDRNYIDRHSSTRVFWAMGVVSLEDDVRKMTLST